MPLRRLARGAGNRLARLDRFPEVWRSVGVPVDFLRCSVAIAIARARRVRRGVVDIPGLLAVGRSEEASNKSRQQQSNQRGSLASTT